MEWDAGERTILTGIAGLGMADVSHVCTGTGERARVGCFTVVVLKRDGVMITSSLRQPRRLSCECLQEVRMSGLSDHAPLEATLRARAIRCSRG